MEATFSANPPYVEYEQLLIKLHQLIADGKGDSDEADEMRDLMDAAYRALSQEEDERLRGLSADLYMLQDNETLESDDAFKMTPERFNTDLTQAVVSRDWETVLILLRKRPASLPRHTVAYLRGNAYEALGDKEAALLFYSHAARSDPQYQDIPALLRAA